MARSAWTRIVVPLLVLVGVPVLIAGFAVNPGPPPGDSLAQITAFGAAHAHGAMLGGWLQILGTVMAGIFALCVVGAAGQATRLPGVLTLLGVALLVSIGLAEFTGYGLVTTGDPTVVDVGTHLITAVQHGYGMVGAPLVFVPLGAVILRTGVLTRTLGIIAVVLGAVFFALGFLGVLAPVQGIVDALSAAQGCWWLAAGINWITRTRRGLQPLTVEA